MCNNTKSYICISELWSVCVSDVDYCTYNICSACPESLICFQFTFLPGDFYRSTLINHRVIYIKAAPCSGSRSHAMVTEVKFKTAGKWPRTDTYLRRQHFKESYLTMYSRYVSFMWSLGIKLTISALQIHQSTTQMLLSPWHLQYATL